MIKSIINFLLLTSPIICECLLIEPSKVSTHSDEIGLVGGLVRRNGVFVCCTSTIHCVSKRTAPRRLRKDTDDYRQRHQHHYLSKEEQNKNVSSISLIYKNENIHNTDNSVY